MKKTGTIASLVCVVVFLAGCGEKAPAPGAATSAPVAAGSGKPFDVSKAAANTLETTSPVLSFATVQYDRAAAPNFITPCYFIVKGIRTAALSNEKFLIDYKITYTSGGQEVTKTVTTKVSESTDHVHDMKNPDENQYVALADRVDVTGQLPDVGTTFSGTAILIKESGGTRTPQITVPVK